MRMVCTKKNLYSGLQLTSKVISSGNTLPILNNILLKTEEGRLRLSGTNLEMAINTWVGGKIEEEGEITVPAKIVNDYVNNLLTDKITINSKNQTLLLEAEKAQTHIKGLPSEEFPLIPKIKDEAFCTTDGKELQKTIQQVSFATAYSETQPEISGILLVFEDGALTLTATDRYRLAEGKVRLNTVVTNRTQLIIPARALNEAARIIGPGTVEILLGEGQICFRSADVELISRLIEGQYPDYKQIIPNHYTTEAEMEKAQLTQGLRAASLFSTDNNNVELELNPQTKQIVIKAQSSQIGDSEIKIDGTFIGEKNSIIFNYRYLLECLTNIDDERVILKVIGPSSPAAIVPAGRDNYLYIVMPIRV